MSSYQKKLTLRLGQKFPGRNPLSLPAIEKIVVNAGVGRALKKDPGKSKDVLLEIQAVLARVCGQSPQHRPARKSVASFGVRAGDTLGLRVTLRRGRMYDFLERLLRLVLPRVRDFRGVPRSSIDAKGNLTLGLAELSVFPEVSALPRASEIGAEVTIVPRSKNREEALTLYEVLGVPFAKK